VFLRRVLRVKEISSKGNLPFQNASYEGNFQSRKLFENDAPYKGKPQQRRWICLNVHAL